MKISILAIIALLGVNLLFGCAPRLGAQPEAETMVASQAVAPTGIASDLAPTSIQLPPPQLTGKLSLEEALSRRRSVREFTDQELTRQQIGQLLWSAQGVTSPTGLRTAPSAGALYPLEVYVVTSDGVYLYEPQEHQLAVHEQGDQRPSLYAAALRQAPVLNAPLVIVIAGVYSRTSQKYGSERSPRYVHLEAGHCAQNVLLQAVALDLGAVPIGAFEDEWVSRVLALPDDQQPLYLIPIGHPR